VSASEPRHDRERAVVLYDRDCGFCRWTLAGLLKLDRHLRLRPMPLQDPEADRLLGGMPAGPKYASAHLVTPDGRIHSGGLAVAPILELLPHGTPASRVARLLPGPLRVGYDWVARHRTLLSRPVPASMKRRATAQIDRHALATRGR
jgi:predicted DCC family thiol-disulfide oxidoreductase YuxK